MKTIWPGRAAQAVAKYGEHAPMAAVCCNACRTCVSTNVIGMAVGGITATAVAVATLARRFAKPS